MRRENGLEKRDKGAPRMVYCSLADFGCLAESVLQAGVSLQFQAHGSSMTPTIRDGDTNDTHSCSFSTLVIFAAQ